MNQVISRAIYFPYKIVFFTALFLLLISPLVFAGNRNMVSALGFVEPQGGVINIGGFTSSTGAIVSEVLVKEGETVKTGQTLAILDTHNILQAAFKLAKAEVDIAKAGLEQVKAGTSKGRINAQVAEIDRLKTELETAKAKCQRADVLHRKKHLSDADREDACLKRKVLQARVRRASATLASLKEVREVDVNVARARLRKAEAMAVKAKAELERSVFRTPLDGRILKLNVRPGQLIGPDGILQLGQTENMWVRTEIYETDIHQVRIGQKATITSDIFPEKLQGTVETIGLMIGKNRLFAVKASADSDSRVVEVGVKLSQADSPKVAELTNLQVAVLIHIGSE